MAVAVGPGPELFQNPRSLPARRIRQCIAECLRPRGLLLGIAGIPIGVILDSLQRARLLRSRHTFDIGPRGHRKGNVDTRAMIGVERAERCRYCRTPIATLRAIACVAEAI